MSKLSFRARALDASKHLPIYLADEIPENADCSLINRAVPQMPTGMEKEEESEHHLQRAICAGMVIPTPEVFDIEDLAYYNKLYPENYKMPRQLIYMQPFSMEADIPDYDMDSDDEHWVNMQAAKLELTPQKFEEMMDRLEKGSGQTVVTLQEAKALIKEDDDLIIAVYDYWLNKRLKTQHPLIPQVKTEARFGVSNHNPYIAFRRRTEKMQTRKNRKNDETSYEKMLKLKRDLSRAVTLLEMVKRREKSKRELLHLTIEVFEKRYQAGDFAGQIVNDVMQQRPPRPAFTPLFQPNHIWNKEDPLYATLTRKEKRQYKKRRHKSSSKNQTLSTNGSGSVSTSNYNSTSVNPDGEYVSSDEDPTVVGSPSDEDEEKEPQFAFRRKMNCQYHCASDISKYEMEETKRDSRLPFSLGLGLSGIVSNGNGLRRRVGRGGRRMTERMTPDERQDFWEYSKLLQQASNSHPSSTDPVPNPKRVFPETHADNVSFVPTPSTSTSANAYSYQQNLVNFRSKSPQPQEPEDVSIDYTTDEDSDSDTKYDPQPAFTLNPGSFIGSVVSRHEQPMVFSVETLLSETAVNTDPTPIPAANYGESVLLDEESSNITNANYFAQLNSGDSDFGFESAWLSGVESMDTGQDMLDLLGQSSLHSVNINQVYNTTNYSSTRTTSESMDVDSEVVIVDSDDTSVETERRRLIDKDNKENDRVSTPGDHDGEGHSIVSENGDGIENSGEDCMIVEEPKSSVVNSSRGMSSSSTLLVDSVGMGGGDGGLDVINSLSKNIVDKTRTNSTNSQLLGSKNFPGSTGIIRKLYINRPRRTDGSNNITTMSDKGLKKGTVNGDSDANITMKYGFPEIPVEYGVDEFSSDTDNNVETVEFGLGRSSKNLHLTVNSNTSSNNNSINMVSSSGPGPAKISLSNGPTVRSIPDCEQGSVVR